MKKQRTRETRKTKRTRKKMNDKMQRNENWKSGQIHIHIDSAKKKNTHTQFVRRHIENVE